MQKRIEETTQQMNAINKDRISETAALQEKLKDENTKKNQLQLKLATVELERAKEIERNRLLLEEQKRQEAAQQAKVSMLEKQKLQESYQHRAEASHLQGIEC